MIQKIIDWVKANWIICLAGLAVIILLFGNKLKRMLFGRTRVKHRAGWATAKSNPRAKTKSGKSIPRSVNILLSRKGYPKQGGGYIAFKKNKDGSIKKAAFVSGTVAAHRRMAHLRHMK